MQLRFTSFAVINSREDFHLQECAHAGRTTQKKPRIRGAFFGGGNSLHETGTCLWLGDDRYRIKPLASFLAFINAVIGGSVPETA